MKKLICEIDCENDFKKEDHIASCLTYVLENFDEIEPTIREFWLNKEMKKLKKEKKKYEIER